MVGASGRRSSRWSFLCTLVLCLTLWPSPSAADGDRDEATAAEGRVFSASELERNPRSEGTPPSELAPEPADPGARLRSRIEPDETPCQLPAIVLEALDPASQRAVVRVGTQPPQVVKPGSTLADTTVVIRQVSEKKLVAEGPPGFDGRRPVLWVHPPRRAGEASRVQCLRPTDSGQGASLEPAEGESEG